MSPSLLHTVASSQTSHRLLRGLFFSLLPHVVAEKQRPASRKIAGTVTLPGPILILSISHVPRRKMWGPLCSPLTTRVAVRVARDRVRNQCASCLVLAAHGHVSDSLTLTHRHGRPRWSLTNQKCREYPRERSPSVRRMEIGRRPDHNT